MQWNPISKRNASIFEDVVRGMCIAEVSEKYGISLSKTTHVLRKIRCIVLKRNRIMIAPAGPRWLSDLRENKSDWLKYLEVIKEYKDYPNEQNTTKEQ